MSQRATYGRCYKGAHRGSCETECAAVLHRPKSRETGVKQREVCTQGEEEREWGSAEWGTSKNAGNRICLTFTMAKLAN